MNDVFQIINFSKQMQHIPFLIPQIIAILEVTDNHVFSTPAKPLELQ